MMMTTTMCEIVRRSVGVSSSMSSLSTFEFRQTNKVFEHQKAEKLFERVKTFSISLFYVYRVRKEKCFLQKWVVPVDGLLTTLKMGLVTSNVYLHLHKEYNRIYFKVPTSNILFRMRIFKKDCLTFLLENVKKSIRHRFIVP